MEKVIEVTFDFAATGTYQLNRMNEGYLALFKKSVRMGKIAQLLSYLESFPTYNVPDAINVHLYQEDITTTSEGNKTTYAIPNLTITTEIV